MTRSLSGFEQQGRKSPASISRCRMPPLWFISTEPDTSFDLHVPQTPFEQDDGSFTPAFFAQETT